MYLEHFSLKQKPFSIAPDPAFIYMSDKHSEALAHLMYGLTSDGGFVLVTGEVGTGKTTLLRNLIKDVPKDQDVAFILNPRLTVRELLETLCDELGVEHEGKSAGSVKHYIDRLNRHLLRTHEAGRSTVVIIDEAQNLSPAVLEQIRLLTNLETNEKKLLRIILLGQPELAETLARTELRQLAQRITARYHLAALSRRDVREYIEHRMRVSGVTTKIFTPNACRAIYRRTRGIPRLINILCDRCLLGAFVEGERTVGAGIVRRAAREVSGQIGRRSYLRWALPVILLAGSAAALGAWLGPDILRAAQQARGTQSSSDLANSPVRTESTRAEIERELAMTEASPSAETRSATTANPRVNPGEHSALAPQDQPITGPEDEAGTLPTSAVARPAPTISPKAVLESPNMQTSSSNGEIVAQSTIRRPENIYVSQLREMAFKDVFKAWGATYDSRRAPCDQAPDAGLRCLGGKTNLDDLLVLDRPAVLELWGTQESGATATSPFFGALVSVSDDVFTMTIGGTQQRVTRAALENHWFGNYTVLWQTPPDFRKSIAIGDRGAQVEWLRQHLESVANVRLGAGERDLFDGELQRALQNYQRNHGLRPDGIAGPLTLIHLHTRTGMPVARLN